MSCDRGLICGQVDLTSPKVVAAAASAAESNGKVYVSVSRGFYTKTDNHNDGISYGLMISAKDASNGASDHECKEYFTGILCTRDPMSNEDKFQVIIFK